MVVYLFRKWGVYLVGYVGCGKVVDIFFGLDYLGIFVLNDWGKKCVSMIDYLWFVLVGFGVGLYFWFFFVGFV